jgi:hypothetical protein
LLIPYNYFLNENPQFYYFITKNEIEYRVAFIVDETFSAISGLDINNIFQIIVEKVTDKREKLDIQVSVTIQSIIIAFFKNSQNSMLYVCDDKDNKSIKRFKVFNRWYSRSGIESTILKKDNVINCKSNSQNTIIYSSLLYHKENRNQKTIIEIYNTMQEILDEK